MRIFKTILSILTLLVIGLIILQCRVAKDDAPSPGEVPKFIPQEFPTNMLPQGADLSSNTVSFADGASKASAMALISGSEDTDMEWTDRNPAATRVRKISPSLDWMTPDPVLKVGDVITLALFEDAVFEARLSNVTRYVNGAVGMTAHLTGEQRGTIYLSYSEQQMRVSVEVPGGADYAVRYNVENGSHYAIEVDRENSIILEGAESPVADEVLSLAAEAVAGSLADSVAAADAPVESTVIDVMIVYTPAALAYEGNLANMNDNIAEAMQRANEAHTNSNTEIYLRLVHSAEINYTESTSSTGYNDDLNYLTDDNDGEMDEVHDWRDQYGADFICLFQINSKVGGLGWLLNTRDGSPGTAFCLARVQQTSWTYTVVHEWGHNMGCHHSKDQEIQSGPTTFGDWMQNKWSAGWQWDDTASDYSLGYCSVMTYENFDGNTNTGYGASGYEYKRVAHFSNPDITYTGNSTNPTGNAVNGDNARTMREMKLVFEAYRESTFVPDPDLDDDGLPNDWELLYFGGETNANPTNIAANGIDTLLDAYIAGINPTNPASFFKASLTNETGFVVQWNSISGRVYSVFGTTNLQESFQPLETNILWPRASWTDHVPRVEHFYQVDVELQK